MFAIGKIEPDQGSNVYCKEHGHLQQFYVRQKGRHSPVAGDADCVEVRKTPEKLGKDDNYCHFPRLSQLK